MEFLFETLLNKTVKISYFNFRNDERTERWLIGKLLSEDETFIQIQGKTDGAIFTINKSHVIEIVLEGDN